MDFSQLFLNPGLFNQPIKMGQPTAFTQAAQPACHPPSAPVVDGLMPEPNDWSAPVVELIPETTDWSGLYFAGNVGYEFSKLTNKPESPDGLAGGLGVGYNIQTGSMVYGVETDIQLSQASETSVDGASTWSTPYFGTIRGRLGYANSGSSLIYGTAGLAYADVKQVVRTPVAATFSNVETGWTAGVGAETQIAPGFVLSGEYLYLKLNEATFGTTRHGLSGNILRAGLKYSF